MKTTRLTKPMPDKIRKICSVAFGLLLLMALVWILMTRKDRIGQVSHLAFSPKGDVLAVIGDVNGKWRIAILDANTRELIRVLGEPSPVYDFIFSSDGKALVAWKPKEIVFWDTETWSVVRRLALAPPPPTDWQGKPEMTVGTDLKTTAFLIRSDQPGRMLLETLTLYDAERNEQLFSITLGESLSHLAFHRIANY